MSATDTQIFCTKCQTAKSPSQFSRSLIRANQKGMCKACAKQRQQRFYHEVWISPLMSNDPLIDLLAALNPRNQSHGI
ncbi:hypothetical protein [Vitreoscilla sp. C1]|uniref:hypothetical protein n=1 Tax=Vitreoscilla sp. (strain C1) TaxID=96942 RepID=UPI00148EB604|nr:hypothetical protein [Vitreoscilla sp. C1]